MVELEEVQSNYGRLSLFIGGKWVDSQSAHGQPVVNPAKAETIAEVHFVTTGEIDKAIETAQSAFER
jgi:malonate-semialdehyde dehydrogenase (acetylating)/methylmalonate-semialdehyde dehydrogenase